MGTAVSNSARPLDRYMKETVVNGKTVRVECIKLNGQIYSVTQGLIKVIGLEDDWYEDVNDPASVIAGLNECDIRADIFTFWQRLPDIKPRYEYHSEWESLAVLPIKSFDHWWNKQIKDKTRNMVRKSKKAGVEVREASYDDVFVKGMTDIFNETPVRQGREFWHYGKDFETVKQQFSRFLFREELIGAYFNGELVGFAMLANAGQFGVLGQIISKIKHRDKAINNALIAKVIEKCETKQLPYLIYAHWNENSLSDFKRHCGFECIKLPRYFVPLTRRGKLVLSMRLHRGWKEAVPRRVRNRLKSLRPHWYNLRSRLTPLNKRDVGVGSSVDR
jgi:Acetyltransferase (GNAT) family